MFVQFCYFITKNKTKTRLNCNGVDFGKQFLQTGCQGRSIAMQNFFTDWLSRQEVYSQGRSRAIALQKCCKD